MDYGTIMTQLSIIFVASINVNKGTITDDNKNGWRKSGLRPRDL